MRFQTERSTGVMPGQGVVQNGTSAYNGTLIDLTGAGGQAQFPAIAPAKGSQIRLNEREKLELVRHAVRNADIYRQFGSRSAFWNTLSTFFEETRGLPLKNPDKVLKRLVDAHRKRASENPLAPGVAVAVTEIEQAVQAWVKIIDDEEAVRAEKRGAKNTQGVEARRVASVARPNSMHRQTEQRRLGIVEEVADNDSNGRRSTNGGSQPSSQEEELMRMRQLLEVWHHKTTGAEDNQRNMEGRLQRHDTEIECLKARINAQDALIRDLMGMITRRGGN